MSYYMFRVGPFAQLEKLAEESLSEVREPGPSGDD